MSRLLASNIVKVGKYVSVEAGTVLDVRNGGIYIGPGAYVAASRIVGPTYIDGMTQVKQFTIIEASDIGYNCRVGGEIEHSVISDHTNKGHTGFIGHSYLGEWINIGAMSTTSDLKMTYGNIKMDRGKSKKIDTGQNKMGSFFADMVKTSIWHTCLQRQADWRFLSLAWPCCRGCAKLYHLWQNHRRKECRADA